MPLFSFIIDINFYNDFTELSECHVSLPAFVDHHHLYSRALSQQGIQACQRIVSVIGFVNPSITYAPSLYPLTAIMLHFMEGKNLFLR